MNKANYIKSSSSKKTKRPVDVNKRKRIDEGEASDGMIRIYIICYM